MSELSEKFMFSQGAAQQIARAYVFQGKGNRDEAVDAFDFLMARLEGYQNLVERIVAHRGEVALSASGAAAFRNWVMNDSNPKATWVISREEAKAVFLAAESERAELAREVEELREALRLFVPTEIEGRYCLLTKEDIATVTALSERAERQA